MGFNVYTPEEVAKILGLRVSTVRTYIRQGKLKAAAFGNRIRVSEEHLREFFNSQLLSVKEEIEEKENDTSKED